MYTISKPKVLKILKASLQKKIDGLTEEMSCLTDSASSETKSSMGDKYETSREMMMQEKNQLGQQRELLAKQMSTLSAIDAKQLSAEVKLGSLVYTEKSIFFISTAAGSVMIDGQQIFAVSVDAPIAIAMKDKIEGESFNINGHTQVIKKIA